METAPFKSFATWARAELITQVSARIAAVLAPASADRTENSRAVRALEADIKKAGGDVEGKDAVADKVAYTWFNRIIALRFMDANGYTNAGVVSPSAGPSAGQPEILADAKRGTFAPDVVNTKTAATVTGLLDGTRPSFDPQGEAYTLLLAEYCRYWNESMPFMFEREGDYTELLIPSNLLADKSILARAVETMTTEACQDVEVIGWLYQFYISERKDEVFAEFKKHKKAGATEIPAATQLFTPHWIVRYLVENSVGRLWMLNHPDSRLIDRMDYYIAPVDPVTDFLKLAGPEDLTVIDPACGSGHMLTYAFDLLYAIYEEEGYSPSEIPSLILTHNLYGTEIDERAGSLASFALTMKARAMQRKFLSMRVSPNISVLIPISFKSYELDTLVSKDGDRKSETAFWNLFSHADILGSLVKPDIATLHAAKRALLAAKQTAREGDLLASDVIARAGSVVHQAELLACSYTVAVANPPYMGSGNMAPLLSDFARSEYSLAKIDTYAMFIERCFELAGSAGSIAMVTQDSWMFLGAYSRYRHWLLNRGSLTTVAHLGTSSFDTISGEVVSTVAFVADTYNASPSVLTVFLRAADVDGGAKANVIERAASDHESSCVWVRSVSAFLDLPNTPVIYWATDDEISALGQGPYLGDLIQAREGLTTGDNDRFLRRWYEVSLHQTGFDVDSTEQSVVSGKRWFPYQKGGSSRRWYGNFDYVVDWENDGMRARSNIDMETGRVRSHNYNGAYGFRRGFTWSGISGDGFAVRHVDGGFMFDAKGPMAFADSEDDLFVLEGFLNSSTATKFMRLLAPRLDFKLGHVLSLPVRIRRNERVASLVVKCIDLSRRIWDSSELSVGFSSLLTVHAGGDFALAVEEAQRVEDDRAVSLAETEEELDTFFTAVYLGDQEVQGTLRLSPSASVKIRNREHVEDFVSYAVGCMFGRYSLDEPGLILANQGATLHDYAAKVPKATFVPDADNVLPIVDGDWFEDDIVARFRQLVRVSFGEEHFEGNLRFIEESLGVKTLRDYFITRGGRSKFYEDHVRRYKKRPIYWMFSSPRGSFNALIYMHRYMPSTVSTVLNEYLREYEAKLEVSMHNSEREASGDGTPRQRAAAVKEAERLRKILIELGGYEHDVMYPLASEQLAIDLDDGVKANYLKFGGALKKIQGL